MMFFEISNLAKWTGKSVTLKENTKIGTLYADPPYHVIRQDGRFLFRTENRLMSDSWTELYCLPSDVKDMCFIRHKQGDNITFFCACAQRVAAVNLHTGFVWSFSGAPTGMIIDIEPTGIAVDQEKQKLYVCDSANQCIQIISTDGVYQGCLVEYYEYGSGSLDLIRWYKQIQSLLIVHERDDTKYLSAIKLNGN